MTVVEARHARPRNILKIPSTQDHPKTREDARKKTGEGRPHDKEYHGEVCSEKDSI